MAQPNRSKPLTNIAELYAYMVAWLTAKAMTEPLGRLLAKDPTAACIWFVACSEARSFYDSTVSDIAGTLTDGIKVDAAYVLKWLATIFEEDEVINTELERIDFLNERYRSIDDMLNQHF